MDEKQPEISKLNKEDRPLPGDSAQTSQLTLDIIELGTLLLHQNDMTLVSIKLAQKGKVFKNLSYTLHKC